MPHSPSLLLCHTAAERWGLFPCYSRESLHTTPILQQKRWTQAKICCYPWENDWGQPWQQHSYQFAMCMKAVNNHVINVSRAQVFWDFRALVCFKVRGCVYRALQVHALVLYMCELLGRMWQDSSSRTSGQTSLVLTMCDMLLANTHPRT